MGIGIYGTAVVRKYHTIEGKLEHTRCHDESVTEKRGNLLIVRGMRIVSHRLHLSGSCDVVEFHADPSGISLQKWDGLWKPIPIEYKHGHSKENDADRLQLCAQAMALEEMLVCEIPKGILFYEETRRKEIVELTDELRQTTQKMADEMMSYFSRGYTPKVRPAKHCNACSIKDLCLPKLYKQSDAAEYIHEHIMQAVTEPIKEEKL